MTKISNPNELPKLIESLKQDSFYGELRIQFRRGDITRVALEQTQVFDSPIPGRTPNHDRHNR